MSRINIISQLQHEAEDGSWYEVLGEERKVLGWFDNEKSTKFDEASQWDGSNNISVATGTQTEHEALYRTAGGRWVLNRWSQYQGVKETYRFIDAEAAAEWLRLNEQDPAIATGIADEPERGPGRPEIGPAINIRLPQELLDHIDDYVRSSDLSRASAIRKLLTEAFLG